MEKTSVSRQKINTRVDPCSKVKSYWFLNKTKSDSQVAAAKNRGKGTSPNYTAIRKQKDQNGNKEPCNDNAR